MRVQLIPLLLCLVLAPSIGMAEPADRLRIAVISDINGRYGSTDYHRRVGKAIERIIALAPDLVISTGDMVAGQRPDPHLTLPQLQAMWHSFQQTVHDPLANAGIPLLMTPGNHDASAYPPYRLERTVYAEYHSRHPLSLDTPPAGNYPFYYRVDLGSVRLISLDATRSGPLDPEQRLWLAGELASDRPYSHTLVFGHLPLQPVARGRERDIVSDAELEDLLEGAAVTAYLSGHHHAFYPGRRLGMDMLSTGNLGGNQRTLVGTAMRTGFSFTLLELAPDGTLDIRALRGEDFLSPIDPRELPATIGAGEHALHRRDLTPPRTAGNKEETAP